MVIIVVMGTVFKVVVVVDFAADMAIVIERQ
jgi:hypothetical protein